MTLVRPVELVDAQWINVQINRLDARPFQDQKVEEQAQEIINVLKQLKESPAWEKYEPKPEQAKKPFPVKEGSLTRIDILLNIIFDWEKGRKNQAVCQVLDKMMEPLDETWAQEQINRLGSEIFKKLKIEEQQQEVIDILNQLPKLRNWKKYVEEKRKKEPTKSPVDENSLVNTIDTLLNTILIWKNGKENQAVEQAFSKMILSLMLPQGDKSDLHKSVQCFLDIQAEILESKSKSKKIQQEREQQAQKRKEEQEDKYGFPQKTKDDGDCGLHAMFGTLSPQEGMFVCADAKSKRDEICQAIIHAEQKSKVKELVMKQIENLVMTNDPETREIMSKVRRQYDEYLKEMQYETYNAYMNLKKALHLNESYKRKIMGAQDEKSAFDDSQLKKRLDSESDPEIIKLPQYQQYHQLTQSEAFKTEWITPGIIEKYGEFLGKPGQWLLPGDLHIIAYIFNKKVIFHNVYSIPETFNPEGSDAVHVRFNGANHYERMLLPKSSLVEQPRPQQSSIISSVGFFTSPLKSMSQPAKPMQAVSDLKEELPSMASPQLPTDLDEKSSAESRPTVPATPPESKGDDLIKSLDKLLAEMKEHELNEGMDTEQLSSQYKQIKEEGKKVADWDQTKILAWSNEIREKLKKDPSTFEAHLPQILAVINRANYIATFDGTKGHSLRDTQLLAVLSLINGTGKLAQIATGEGKTTIIAVLAAIKVLKGERVDIVTSSPVLAMRDAQEKQGFYQLFGLKCAHNHREEKEKLRTTEQLGQRDCYKADIVYGSMHDFQFDHLDHAHQELQTRGDRGFPDKTTEGSSDAKASARLYPLAVIIDEIDCMLIDNGGHIAKMSGPLPGIEHLLDLQYIIWEKINAQPDLKAASGYKEDLQREIIEIIKNRKYNERSLIIPEQFQEYAKGQVSQWIEHAITAKFEYTKNHQYTIEEKDKEEVITPVDFSNTGGLQNNTVWSDGLHQFIQIKEGVRVTPESLTTSFISNIAYIKLYKSNMIGLTGTLGSKQARELLETSYPGIKYAFVPTYKAKKLKPEDVKKSIHEGREEWLAKIEDDVASRCKMGQAGLIICETIQDAMELKERLEAKYPGKIREFLKDSDIDKIAKNGKITVDSSEIIISTNLSGRGTDIETTESVEKSGGLHVCVTFLPRNQRVEDQAIGRTARQGKKGSASIVIEEEQTKQLLRKALPDQKIEQPLRVDKLKKLQTQMETAHLDRVKEHELTKLEREDALFTEFSKFYRGIKKQLNEAKDSQAAPPPGLLLKAIEEQWGLWLKRESGRSAFDKFRSLIVDEHGNLKYDNFISSSYCVLIGNHYLEADDYENAIKYYEKALEHDPDCYAAHGQLALAYIEKCEAFSSHIIDFVKKYGLPALLIANPIVAGVVTAVIEAFPTLSKDKRGEYLAKAKAHFERCSQLIASYVLALEYMCDHSITAIVKSDQDDGQLSPTCKYLSSKIALLEYQKESIDAASTLLKDKSTAYIAVQNAKPLVLDDLGEESAKVKAQISQVSIDDLRDAGFGNTFSVVELSGVSDDVAKANGILIAGGCGIIALGLATGVLAKQAIDLGTNLIFSGVSNLITALLYHETEFNLKDFLTNIGVDALTSLAAGLDISKLSKIFKFGSKGVRSIKQILPTVKQMGVMTKRASAVDKLRKAGRSLYRIPKKLMQDTLVMALEAGLSELGEPLSKLNQSLSDEMMKLLSVLIDPIIKELEEPLTTIYGIKGIAEEISDDLHQLFDKMQAIADRVKSIGQESHVNDLLKPLVLTVKELSESQKKMNKEAFALKCATKMPEIISSIDGIVKNGSEAVKKDIETIKSLFDEFSQLVKEITETIKKYKDGNGFKIDRSEAKQQLDDGVQKLKEGIQKLFTEELNAVVDYSLGQLTSRILGKEKSARYESVIADKLMAVFEKLGIKLPKKMDYAKLSDEEKAKIDDIRDSKKPMGLAALRMLADMKRRIIEITIKSGKEAEYLIMKPRKLRKLQAHLKSNAKFEYEGPREGDVGHFHVKYEDDSSRRQPSDGNQNCGIYAFKESIGNGITKQQAEKLREELADYTMKHPTAFREYCEQYKKIGLDQLLGGGTLDRHPGLDKPKDYRQENVDGILKKSIELLRTAVQQTYQTKKIPVPITGMLGVALIRIPEDPKNKATSYHLSIGASTGISIECKEHMNSIYQKFSELAKKNNILKSVTIEKYKDGAKNFIDEPYNLWHEKINPFPEKRLCALADAARQLPKMSNNKFAFFVREELVGTVADLKAERERLEKCLKAEKQNLEREQKANKEGIKKLKKDLDKANRKDREVIKKHLENIRKPISKTNKNIEATQKKIDKIKRFMTGSDAQSCAHCVDHVIPLLTKKKGPDYFLRQI